MCQHAASRSASASVSSATVSYSPTLTAPRLAVGAGARSGSGWSGGGSMPETAFATASTAWSLRQLVARVSRSAGRSATPGKVRANRSMVPAEAPRQP